MWSAFISWLTVGIAVPVIVGIGMGVLSMSPPHYNIAQVCFTISAAILAVKVGWWIAFAQPATTTTLQRGLFAFVIYGPIGVLWAISVAWVTGLRPVQAHASEGESFLLKNRPSKASITFGEGSTAVSNQLSMDQFESGLELKAFAGDREVATLKMKPNGQVALNAHTMYEGATIKLHDSSLTVQGVKFDKNFSKSEFEVVDPDGVVIFQLVRKSPFEIQINGVFPISGGSFFLAGPKGVLETNTVRFDYAPTRIFKYPSWRFPGQYANAP